MSIMRISTIAAIIVLTGLAGFHLLLALGFPLGTASWGGKQRILPPGLRVASFASTGVIIFAILIVLEKSGLISILDSPVFIDYSTWALCALFGLSTIGNMASISRMEKKIMIPVASILFLAFFAIAVSS